MLLLLHAGWLLLRVVAAVLLAQRLAVLLHLLAPLYHGTGGGAGSRARAGQGTARLLQPVLLD